MVNLTVLHNELDSFNQEKSGFSVFIEVCGSRILLDTSISDDFIKNSKKSNIDLKDVDFLIISHGHCDHTGGLKYLLDYNLTLVAHPDFLKRKTFDGENIGIPISREDIEKYYKLKLSREPYKIVDNVFFLGEIPRLNSFEGRNTIGKCEDEKDFVLDDSALAIDTEKGLVIISGCSHSGICNIIEYSKKVTGNDRVYSVFGGFHLFNEDDVDKTIEYFRNQNIDHIYATHCLSDYAFSEFAKIGGKRISTLQRIVL